MSSLALGLVLVLPIAAQTPDAIQYLYDGLNRLARVIDQNGKVATYVYDDVGNILRIERATVDTLPPTAVSSSSSSTLNQGISTTLILTGTSLLGAQVTTTCPDVTIDNLSVTDTEIRVTLTAAATTPLAACALTVTTALGTASIPLTVLGQRPDIASISPSEGPSFGGTPVTVSGNHFTPDTTVAIGGNPATEISFVGPTTLTAKTPTGPATNPPTAVDVVVANPIGSDSLPGGFLYRMDGWLPRAPLPTPRGALVAETLSDATSLGEASTGVAASSSPPMRFTILAQTPG